MPLNNKQTILFKFITCFSSFYYFSNTIQWKLKIIASCIYIYIYIEREREVNNGNKSNSMKKLEKQSNPKVVNLFSFFKKIETFWF